MHRHIQALLFSKNWMNWSLTFRDRKRLFWGPWRNSLPGGNWKPEELLGEWRWASRGLCWNIKLHKTKIIVFNIKPSYFSNHPCNIFLESPGSAILLILKRKWRKNESLFIRYAGISAKKNTRKEVRVFLHILGTKFILPDNRSHARIDEISYQNSSYVVNDII